MPPSDEHLVDFQLALDSLEDAVMNGLSIDSQAQRVLDAWVGDYDVRRQNGRYHVTLFEPSREYEVWSIKFTSAVREAARSAVNRNPSRLTW